MRLIKKTIVLACLGLFGCAPSMQNCILACSPDVPKKIPAPDPRNEKVNGDGDGTEVFDPAVDILFVIDDSASMGIKQQNLIANISRFVDAFTKRANIDYHIGVVTTTMDLMYPSVACCGKMYGRPNVVDRNTAGLVSVLKTNMLVGTQGSGSEHVFDPIMAALSSPNIDTINQGFYRPSAHLAVVMITDAEDQSRVSSQDVYDFLVRLKGRKELVIGYGVIVPSTITDCPRDEDRVTPQKIEAFLQMMPNAGTNEFNLCDPAFGDRVSQIADDLVRYVGNVIYLSRPPILSTIQVTFGSQVIPRDVTKGWSFDPSRNAIILADQISWSSQPNGTKMNVKYEAAAYPQPSVAPENR